MVHMEPEYPREWEVTINRRKCPAVYYPANYVGCQLLPNGCRCSLDNCPLKTTKSTDELCPICNKPLYGSGKTLTCREYDEKVVHLSCYISKPCDCEHEHDGCHYSGYCEYRRAPDKDLNGTLLPTCGFRFPDKMGGD